TTLLRVPPEMTPGFTVIPQCNCVNPTIVSICRASSTTTLAPASKSTPTCEARPFTTTSNPPTPLRAVFNFPVSPVPGSSTSTTLLFDTFFSVSERETSLPTSSSGFSYNNTLDPTAISNSHNARTANRKNTIPAFISSTPGP